jgi:hypothetical protein
LRKALNNNYNLGLFQGTDYYIPTDYAAYRQLEPDYRTWLTDGVVDFGVMVEWMGGQIIKGATIRRLTGTAASTT